MNDEPSDCQTPETNPKITRDHIVNSFRNAAGPESMGSSLRKAPCQAPPFPSSYTNFPVVSHRQSSTKIDHGILTGILAGPNNDRKILGFWKKSLTFSTSSTSCFERLCKNDRKIVIFFFFKFTHFYILSEPFRIESLATLKNFKWQNVIMDIFQMKTSCKIQSNVCVVWSRNCVTRLGQSKFSRNNNFVCKPTKSWKSRYNKERGKKLTNAQIFKIKASFF